MTDVISAALRARADGDIHIDRLLAAVHAGARRRRRRRIAATACAVVAAVAVAAAGGVAVSGTGGAPVGPATSTSPGEIPRPPLVEGVPVASFTPTALGSDPTLFHLDLTGMGSWTMLSWSSRAGYEELIATSDEVGGDLFVQASQSPDKLPWLGGESTRTTVRGLPAELVRATSAVQGAGVRPPQGGHAVRWEAVPGVWVQVVVPAGREMTLSIAERVRLDRTFRCALPFRFSGLGDRVRVIKCETWFSGDRTLANVWLADGDADGEYFVRVGYPATAPATTETIGGRAVTVVGGDTPHLEYPYEGGVAYFHPFYSTLDDPFLRSLVPAFVPVSDPDPDTWPRSPLS